MATLKKEPDWNEGLRRWGQGWAEGWEEVWIKKRGCVMEEGSQVMMVRAEDQGAGHGNSTFGQRRNGGAHD